MGRQRGMLSWGRRAVPLLRALTRMARLFPANPEDAASSLIPTAALLAKVVLDPLLDAAGRWLDRDTTGTNILKTEYDCCVQAGRPPATNGHVPAHRRSASRAECVGDDGRPRPTDVLVRSAARQACELYRGGWWREHHLRGTTRS